MSLPWLLALYGLLIVLASLAGGFVPMVLHLTHKRMQIAISLVAGFMLGVALLQMLPHALLEPEGAPTVMLWVLAGLLVMFFLERFFCFHHHDAPRAGGEVDDDATDACALHDHGHGHGHDAEHGHGHAHAGDHCPDPSPARTNPQATNEASSPLGPRPSALQPPPEDVLVQYHEHKLTWSGAAVGLTLHSLIDGVALAAAMQAQRTSGGSYWPGLAVFLVVFFHRPFDAMTLGTLLRVGGWNKAPRHVINGLFALIVPIGSGLFLFAADLFADPHGEWLGAALGFSAGIFLCIAMSDLLPELQFHHHDRGKLSAALLLGLALAWAISYAEQHSAAHEHHVQRHQHDEHEHEH